MRTVFIIATAISLSGCGIAAEVNAKHEYVDSTEAYKACLAAHPTAPQQCEAARLAMDADERKLNNSHIPRQDRITVINR